MQSDEIQGKKTIRMMTYISYVEKCKKGRDNYIAYKQHSSKGLDSDKTETNIRSLHYRSHKENFKGDG